MTLRVKFVLSWPALTPFVSVALIRAAPSYNPSTATAGMEYVMLTSLEIDNTIVVADDDDDDDDDDIVVDDDDIEPLDDDDDGKNDDGGSLNIQMIFVLIVGILILALVIFAVAKKVYDTISDGDEDLSDEEE